MTKNARMSVLSSPLLAVASMAAALIATPVLAQPAAAPIATAQAALPPTPHVSPEPLRIADLLPDDGEAAPMRDNKVHGFVEAGVGTGGYRQVAAGLDAPLPHGGEIAVAVATTQFDGARGHR
jgi:hypothetical protein